MSKRVREDEEDEAPAVVEAPAPEAPAASSDPKQEKQERQARDARMALAALPDQEMYEKSYMHRDVVTHLVVTATDFIVTASAARGKGVAAAAVTRFIQPALSALVV